MPEPDSQESKPRFRKWYNRGSKYPYKVATIDAAGNPENVWEFKTEFERQNFIREKLDYSDSQTFTYWNK